MEDGSTEEVKAKRLTPLLQRSGLMALLRFWKWHGTDRHYQEHLPWWLQEKQIKADMDQQESWPWWLLQAQEACPTNRSDVTFPLNKGCRGIHLYDTTFLSAMEGKINQNAKENREERVFMSIPTWHGKWKKWKI